MAGAKGAKDAKGARADSVSLKDAVKASKQAAPAGNLTWMRGILLFAIFMFVVSDIFVNNVASFIPRAVDGREPTEVGTVVQGVCLVLFYAVAIHLLNQGIL
jgi:hypothetical protein